MGFLLVLVMGQRPGPRAFPGDGGGRNSQDGVSPSPVWMWISGAGMYYSTRCYGFSRCGPPRKRNNEKFPESSGEGRERKPGFGLNWSVKKERCRFCLTTPIWASRTVRPARSVGGWRRGKRRFPCSCREISHPPPCPCPLSRFVDEGFFGQLR